MTQEPNLTPNLFCRAHEQRGRDGCGVAEHCFFLHIWPKPRPWPALTEKAAKPWSGMHLGQCPQQGVVFVSFFILKNSASHHCPVCSSGQPSRFQGASCWNLWLLCTSGSTCIQWAALLSWANGKSPYPHPSGVWVNWLITGH